MKIDILAQIVAEKRREVAQLNPQLKQVTVRQDYRDFASALRRQKNIALIAEVKKASPSAGVIRADFDPVCIAGEYEAAGATALSVLTDEKFFQGRLDYLRQIREVVQLPLLRKDFIIDELQIYEAVNADAVLLIAAILDDAQLRDYRQLAGQLKLAALVEVHDEKELERALNAGAEIIGMAGRLGVLRAGAIADILVVDGNPLTDISCLLGQGEGISVIIKDGKIYKGQD